MRFVKGHGTGNDFVIVDEDVHLTPQRVAQLCDRRFGIGGDGVLRVLPASGGDAEWFMDYWNSDGSLSEMCGNGIRVFARYLLVSGLAGGDVIPISTRAGVRTAYVEGDDIRIDMGAPVRLGHSKATLDGVAFDGEAISMGNPHLVCTVPDVAGLDLSRRLTFDGAFFPQGVNVEFSQVDLSVGAADAYRRMRVIERGSGETMSCGTGATAVGVAALFDAGRDTGSVVVDVPGGRLTITLDAHTSWLAGPAVLTFTGETTS